MSPDEDGARRPERDRALTTINVFLAIALVGLIGVGAIVARRVLADPAGDAIRDRSEAETTDGTRCFVYPPHDHYSHPPFPNECPRDAKIFCIRAGTAEVRSRCARS